ncbi:MAG: two-component system cell cycle response regulator CpdR [Alphaproteobacteria bacterium]|jgi:two-component system cell cycle response regulator CpdR
MANILLAEDDEALASFLVKSLKRAGHRVTFARDGIEAYEKILSANYDLLLTDLAMPGMDGIDLVKKAREHLTNLRVMFITGFSAVAIEENMHETEIISKPFHLKELTDRIETMLKNDLDNLSKTIEEKIQNNIIETSSDTDK